jgi:DNA-binding MarR family transcriptional regulator
MDALELVDLGRRLCRIGEEAMRAGRGPGMPAGPALVLRDVFGHPDGSVNDIALRTGLPQGYVSECVAKLRADGMVETTTDRADRRRTLVRFSHRHASHVLDAGAVPVDEALGRALGDTGSPALAETVEVLSRLARRLRPKEPSNVALQLRPRPEA